MSYELKVMKNGQKRWFKDGKMVSKDDVPEDVKEANEGKARASDNVFEKTQSMLEDKYPEVEWEVTQRGDHIDVRAFENTHKELRNGEKKEIKLQVLRTGQQLDQFNVDSLMRNVDRVFENRKVKEILKKRG